ncbi:MAG: triose-phosphate isomerase, partial [Desulfuromonadales bacterium]|nr:triose-phosphate isomerase [Desulfuromonadales bacterium]
TGEISPWLLKDCGCSHVIVGHSERRQILGETDEFINRKVKACLAEGLVVILCIGETLEEREGGKMLDVLRRQIRLGTAELTPADLPGLIVAYEPVWAIGTGKTASDLQAQEAHAFIRGQLRELFGPEGAESLRILYGGSVKPDNVGGLMAQPDIDGTLVGGASLKADDFTGIVRYPR